MSNTIKLSSPLEKDSIANGEGLRTVIWTQGCSHNCKGCHNPLTHSFDGGFEVSIDDIKQQLDELKGQDGITLSGGDPLFQIDAALEIAKYARKKNLNVWVYTGFTYEEIRKMNPKYIELLHNIDVLVDGKFILEEKNLNLKFKGSKNQRIIDVPLSLELEEVMLVSKYEEVNTNQNIYERKEFIFV